MTHRDEREFVERFRRIPEPIVRVSDNNPLVHRICQEYAAGRICLLDEALCQMVLGLATNWERQQKAYMDLMMVANPPQIIVPKIP